MCVVLGFSIIVLVVPGLFAIHRANYSPFFTHGVSGLALSFIPLFFSYAGFESLAQTAGETKGQHAPFAAGVSQRHQRDGPGLCLDVGRRLWRSAALANSGQRDAHD